MVYFPDAFPDSGMPSNSIDNIGTDYTPRSGWGSALSTRALGQVSTGLNTVGTIGSTYAKMAAYQSEAAADMKNAIAARIATMFKSQDIQDEGQRLASTQASRIGASGADITTGSMARVMIDSAGQIEKEVYRAKYAGKMREQADIDAANAADKSAEMSGLSGLVSLAAVLL